MNIILNILEYQIYKIFLYNDHYSLDTYYSERSSSYIFLMSDLMSLCSAGS